MIHFSDYQFDPAQQILYRNGEIVTLTVNQTKLLALFLSQPEKILSKDDILQNVWSERVVSEQVVFQNISQLRTIFSDEAIKTFTKRGYQWQLPLEIKEAPQPAITVKAIPIDPKFIPRRVKWKIGGFVLMVIFMISAIVTHEPKEKEQAEATEQQVQASMIVIPFSSRFEREMDDVINQHNQKIISQFSPNEAPLKKDVTTWDFFNSPFMVRKELVSDSNTLVMTGLIYQRNYSGIEKGPKSYVLEYMIQGNHRKWHGFLLSDKPAALTEKLAQQANLVANSQFFSLSTDAFTTAELSVLHSQHPSNLDVLKHLIERLIDEENYDVASARIEQMQVISQAQDHRVYQAYAVWLEGQLLSDYQQYDLALNTLESANEMMVKANILSLQSEISKTLADVHHLTNNYEQAKAYLFESASQARLAKRPVQEIRSYTLLSIKASKFGLDDEKLEHLYKAKTLILDYKLDNSHYMLPFYHFALFAKTAERKENQFLRVVNAPITPLNYWVFFSSSRQLINMYIAQERWAEALELVKNVDEPARAASLNAKIYRAQGKLEEAYGFAKTSFNSARAQRIDWLGADMALLLLELKKQFSNDENVVSSTDVLTYKRYIREVPKVGWMKENEARLANVGITLDPYSKEVANR